MPTPNPNSAAPNAALDQTDSLLPRGVTGWAARIKAFLRGSLFSFRRPETVRLSAAPQAGSSARIETSSPQNDEVALLRQQLAQSQRNAASLLAERDAALETLRQKTEFFASVCHEIRTPLNGVLGMMELLSLTELDAEQSRLAQAGVRSGQLLRALLTDVMDFSRRGLGRFELRPEPFDPRELTHAVCQMLQPAEAAMGVGFTCEVAPEVPGTLVGSPVRIAQIISNLASNALKFTRQGAVRVVVGMEPDAAQPGHTGLPGKPGRLSITVSDTGIGIPASQHRRIFEPFHQARPTHTAQGFATAHGVDTTQGMDAGNRHGVGLGLSITRNLVEAMNGTISVESIEGQGSRFQVSIPVSIATNADSHLHVVSGAPATPRNPAPTPDPTVAEPAIATSLAGSRSPLDAIPDHATLRVLVAEDNPVNRLLLDRQLQKLGCHVVTCESGEEALELWSSFRPDIVFTDHHMPGMSGLALAQSIREREHASPGSGSALQVEPRARVTRIVLATGSHPDLFAADKLPVEIDGLLPKPFAMSELVVLLARARNGQPTTTAHLVPNQSSRPHRLACV